MSPKKVEIISKKTAYQRSIFRVDEVELRHEKFNGKMTDPITRLSFERGDSVAALMHNPEQDTIVLVEQFRYPTLENGTGWIVELPAGVIEKNEAPKNTMIREIEEETGYRVHLIHHLFTFFLSPGGTSERIFLYYGRIDPKQRVSKGGGLAAEDENIKTTHVKVDDALKRMHNKEFKDAKTILALQWLEMNRSKLADLKENDEKINQGKAD